MTNRGFEVPKNGRSLTFASHRPTENWIYIASDGGNVPLARAAPAQHYINYQVFPENAFEVNT